MDTAPQEPDIFEEEEPDFFDDQRPDTPPTEVPEIRDADTAHCKRSHNPRYFKILCRAHSLLKQVLTPRNRTKTSKVKHKAKRKQKCIEHHYTTLFKSSSISILRLTSARNTKVPAYNPEPGLSLNELLAPIEDIDLSTDFLPPLTPTRPLLQDVTANVDLLPQLTIDRSSTFEVTNKPRNV